MPYEPTELGRTNVTGSDRTSPYAHLPVAAVRALGAERGDRLVWYEEDDRVYCEIVED